VFVKDSRIMPISIKGTLFEVGKANLKKEALPTLKAVADYAREYPDQMLAISGHTDASPIHTKEFPSNQELSEARAEAVKAYLVTDEGIYPARITTTGFGPSQPVATNATKDGRALNRRVEIMMTTEGRLFENYYRTIHIKIPVSYHGSAPVTSLEIRDRLDTAFHFIDGSGRFAGAPIAPEDNTDLLTWTIRNVGTSLVDTLSYDVQVYAPKAGTRAARSSSTLSYTIGTQTATLDASCWTTNIVARTVKNTPVRLIVPGAFVDAETAELTTEAMNHLLGAADILKSFPNATALIEGHTGPRDPEAAGFSSNVALSKARAAAVLHALVTKFGIDSSRMQATGWGELKPASVKDKSANNRVEILIDKPEVGVETFHEHSADTSETLTRTIGDARESETAASGDRVILTITASAPLGRDVRAIAVTDTLPAGVVPEEGSLVGVRGVDSLSIDGNVIHMRWSAADTVHVYRVTATLSGSGDRSRRLSITRTIGTRTMIEIPEAVKLRVEATKGRTRP
jgi:flagellar motor protein MotB